MANIGGNIAATIQRKTDGKKNAIGERENVWADAYTVRGWLGLQSGENKRTSFNAKIEESTHVFLCDYHSGVYSLADQDTRATIKGNVYDVLLIDNPDEMDEQLEIYLRKVGAWDGK
jgi:hypothetical protein